MQIRKNNIIFASLKKKNMKAKALQEKLRVIEIERQAALEKTDNEKQRKFIAGQLDMITKVQKLLHLP